MIIYSMIFCSMLQGQTYCRPTDPPGDFQTLEECQKWLEMSANANGQKLVNGRNMVGENVWWTCGGKHVDPWVVQ